ncbi:fibronectin type III domain-containing protein [Microbacterium oleivorans]|uniref:Fibronectin type-III domain-containing protein n=1 Tax=Microbacterium oleivorans TaxID=273677 RepID=A0A4R5YJY8_9MICO|nr:DUF859 family phage minor structural protein [Microbacterium oleivorans]TDL43604.1 hypothetical protein E2R54_10345 [Microbacterium oleivorans]
MPTISALHNSNSAYRTYLEVDLDSQSVSGNTSTVSWRVYTIKSSGTGYSGSGTGDGDASVNGSVWNNGSFSYDFTGGSPKTVTLASGTRTIGHASDGTKTISYSFNVKLGVVGTASASGSYTLPRIAKEPDAPGTPTLSAATTSSVDVDWNAPSNNGASISGYQVQRATNSAFSAGVSTSSTSSRSITLSGLASGTDYWFRVRAQNSVGWSDWSGSRTTATRATGPTGLAASSLTPTSFTLGWNAPSGNAIDSYQIQQAKAADFTGATTWSQTARTLSFSGLEPATTYYHRVRAMTASGYGNWSSTFTVTPGLPAPQSVTAATETTGYKLRINWAAPSITTGLTGYRVQVSTESNFSSTVLSTDLGNVLTYDAALAGGRLLYVRVAALTAGGANTWSSTVSVVHLANSGVTDGWTRVGTKPAGIAYYTSTGIRRGVVSGQTPALWVESLSTGNASIAQGALGIQRTFTGLKVGKTYRFQARATVEGVPVAHKYRLEVVTEGTGTTTPVNVDTDLGKVDFVADATSVVARIMLDEAVTVSGQQPRVERVAFHGVKLLELVTDYPARLQDTVYETDLANHFDLACNSVGATWYVARDGVTRFRLPGTFLPSVATFSDDATADSRSYIDITAGVETLSLINRIVANNYGEEGGNELNEELIVEDAASKALYGTYTQNLDLNLYNVAPYSESLQARLAELLALHKDLEPLVKSIVWNAQEDLDLAAALEVGDRITVVYRGVEQDSQIVSLQHTITPTRWLITLNLRTLT